MRSVTSVDLAVSWPDACGYLSRRWTVALRPYLDQEQSSIVSARLTFASDDPLLEEFLAFAEQKAVREPGDGGFLGRLGGKGHGGPLLRAVRRWSEYDFADVQGCAVVQLLLDRIVELAPPLSQYYRVDIAPTADCPGCGQVHLRQQHPLRVREDDDADIGLHGHAWQPADHIAATANHEIIISQHLRDLWETVAAPDLPQFLPVEDTAARHQLWQATPQGIVHVMAPPTPLQVRDRCPTCGRPLTVALSTAPSDAAFGPGRQTVYEQEVTLTVDSATLPAGDLWITDLQEGRIRELNDVLQGFEDNPDPFYVRSSRPFWLASQRLLRLLHDHVASGWRCRPVNIGVRP